MRRAAHRIPVRGALIAGLALTAVLAAAAPALAATPAHGLAAPPIASIGSLLGGLVGTVLGGVTWTVNVAASFIENLLGGLVKDLIPRSWLHKGLEIMQWLVAVPDFAGKIPAPGGGQVYGFPGVNAIRSLDMWFGIAILPLTALYATSRAWSGQGDHVAMPLVRVVTVSIGVLSYTWLWGQAVAGANLITTAILSVPEVSKGIYKMFTLIVTGVALNGLDLVGELVMFAAAVGLLGMIFLKVVVILAGALVYAIGPLMIGLAPTERGHAVARTWMSLTTALFALGILWAFVFGISAVLIADAGTGGALIGGNTSIGQLFGGLLIAVAAIAGFWLNIKLTKALSGVLGGQLAGMLSMVGARGGAGGLLGGAGRAGAGASAIGSAGASLRGFAAKVGGGAAGALGAIAPTGRGSAAFATAAAGAGVLARGGLIGAGGALAGRGLAGAASSSLGRAAGATRAGLVATRMARSGRRGWNAAATSVAAGQAAGVVGGATAANKARKAATAASPATPAATPPAAAAPAPGPAPGGAGKTPPGPAPPGARPAAGARPPAHAGPASGATPPAPGPASAGARPRAAPPVTASPARPGAAAPAPRSSAPATPASPAPSSPGPVSSPFAQRPAAKPSRSFRPRFRKGPRKP
jgi:hypothetical protein